MHRRKHPHQLRTFFLGVHPDKDTHPLLDMIQVIALYSVCGVFLFSSVFNLSLVMARGSPLDTGILVAYAVLSIAALATFWVSRKIMLARIPVGIALAVLIAQQMLYPGGVYGLGFLNFYFCIPIVYLFFGLGIGATFMIAYFAAISFRLSLGNFVEPSILTNPAIPPRLTIMISLATVVGVITCACLEKIITSLSRIAFYDQITVLPNRFKIEERLKQDIKFGKNKKFSVLGIRILNYNKINAMLGTDQGDNLMSQIGQRLEKLAGEGHFTGRWSGSLFVSIQYTTDHAKIEAFAKAILENLSAPYQLESHRPTVLFAVSVSRYPYDALSSRQLMSNIISLLDHNLPGDVLFFNNENLREQHYHFSLIELLNKAETDRDFSLMYQPKIRIADGGCTGAEILLRWNDISLGNISPSVFIPLAEQSGQIRKITRWVIRRAFAEIGEGMRSWNEASDFGTFAINLSVMDLRDRDFTAFLGKELERSGIPPETIEFEITEGSMVDDDPQIRKSIKSILDLGFRISIDDFGTGYSSLSYLHRLHVHALKIDQSFVRVLDPSNAPIIDAIISMGKSLGLDVIAEGVESREQLEYLKMKGCDTAQGWLFSKAVEFAQFAEFRRQITESIIIEETDAIPSKI